MTAPFIDVGVEVTPAVAEFNRMAGRFQDFRPILSGKVDEAVRFFLLRRFETEGRLGSRGGRWEALTPRYSASKEKAVGHKKVLQRSGEMMRAFTTKGDPHQVVRVGADFYSLTVDDTIQPRARGHQHGVPSIGLPQREIIPDPMPRNFVDELALIVKSYVVRGER